MLAKCVCSRQGFADILDKHIMRAQHLRKVRKSGQEAETLIIRQPHLVYDNLFVVVGEPPVALGTKRKRNDEKSAEVKKMKTTPPTDKRMIVINPVPTKVIIPHSAPTHTVTSANTSSVPVVTPSQTPVTDKEPACIISGPPSIISAVTKEITNDPPEDTQKHSQDIIELHPSYDLSFSSSGSSSSSSANTEEVQVEYQGNITSDIHHHPPWN